MKDLYTHIYTGIKYTSHYKYEPEDLWSLMYNGKLEMWLGEICYKLTIL